MRWLNDAGQIRAKFLVMPVALALLAAGAVYGNLWVIGTGVTLLGVSVLLWDV
jgi:hypothetical protein